MREELRANGEHDYLGFFEAHIEQVIVASFDPFGKSGLYTTAMCCRLHQRAEGSSGPHRASLWYRVSLACVSSLSAALVSRTTRGQQ